LNGKTIGVLDISKPGGSIFWTHRAFAKERHGVANVIPK